MSLDPSANILSPLYLIWRRVLFMKCILLISRDGWMVCTVCYVKPRLFRPHERDVFTICPFWTIGPTCLLKQRYFSTGQNSCSSLYSMLYNTFFLKVVSKARPAAYTMYNSLNWISFKRTDDRDTIYDGCNMIKGTHWVWSSNLGYVI